MTCSDQQNVTKVTLYEFQMSGLKGPAALAFIHLEPELPCKKSSYAAEKPDGEREA